MSTGHANLVDRTAFLALLEQAVHVAEPLSAPLLFLVDLAGLNEIAQQHGPEAQARLAHAAAWQVADALGDGGYVCTLRGSRLAVLGASDGGCSADAIGNAVLGSLARPITNDGVTLVPGATLGMARWGIDGETTDELFVAADMVMQATAIKWSLQSQCRELDRKHSPMRYLPSPLQMSA